MVVVVQVTRSGSVSSGKPNTIRVKRSAGIPASKQPRLRQVGAKVRFTDLIDGSDFLLCREEFVDAFLCTPCNMLRTRANMNARKHMLSELTFAKT